MERRQSEEYNTTGRAKKRKRRKKRKKKKKKTDIKRVMSDWATKPIAQPGRKKLKKNE